MTLSYSLHKLAVKPWAKMRESCKTKESDKIIFFIQSQNFLNFVILFRMQYTTYILQNSCKTWMLYALVPALFKDFINAVLNSLSYPVRIPLNPGHFEISAIWTISKNSALLFSWVKLTSFSANIDRFALTMLSTFGKTFYRCSIGYVENRKAIKALASLPSIRKIYLWNEVALIIRGHFASSPHY